MPGGPPSSVQSFSLFSFQIFLLLQMLHVDKEADLINPMLVVKMTTQSFIEAFVIGSKTASIDMYARMTKINRPVVH